MRRYKFMTGMGLFAAIAIAGSPAQAAGITYLECLMSDGGSEQMQWKIALDENAKTVTFEHAMARGATPGIFTADRVSWSAGQLSISRLDLVFTRTILGHTANGKCQLVDPPKRAF